MLKEKNKKNYILILVSILIIIIAVIIVFYKYYCLSKNKKYEENSLDDFYVIQEQIKNKEIYQSEINDNVIKTNKESYIAVLKIEKINLTKGIYEKNSINNDVNKNIQLLYESDMPDVENGNMIIAGHSGSSYIAYFNNLSKLNIGDEANIFYNGKTYLYKLHNFYEIEKTGKVDIYKNDCKTTLTLITCKQNTNKQIVFVFELEK